MGTIDGSCGRAWWKLMVAYRRFMSLLYIYIISDTWTLLLVWSSSLYIHHLSTMALTVLNGSTNLSFFLAILTHTDYVFVILTNLM